MGLFDKKKTIEVAGITLDIRSWNDVSIALYKDIVHIIEDEDIDEITKDVEIIALLCDVSPDYIWNLRMDEINELKSHFVWVKDFDFPKDIKYKSIKIGGEKYDITVDIDKMSIAQYVDFQALWNPNNILESYAKVLSCFIIPKGKKYNDGYDIQALQQTIESEISIATANGLCFFFLRRLGISIKGMAKFLRWTMKMTNPKDKEKKEKVMEQLKLMEAMVSKYTIGSV